MAETTIAIEMPFNYDGTWSHIFQGSNTSWLFENRQINGNFFGGLQAQTQNAWDAQIPKNSKILAATMEYTPFNSNANPSFDTTMSTPDRAQQTQRQDPLQAPFTAFRGYRRDFWSNAQVGGLSTTFTAVFGTSVTTNASWIMRQLTAPTGIIPNRAHMAQLITTRTGNMTLDFIVWDLSRTGNPSGDLTVRIQGIKNDRGVTIPDGVDIAVSDPVAASTVPLVQGIVGFFFNPEPTLVELTDYFILIEGTYPANNADHITVYHQNTFFQNGQLYHFGDGFGMDWQNHPGDVDLDLAHQGVRLPGGDVIWPIDAHVVGVTETSPDISALVQAQLEFPNYTIDSGIFVTLSRNTPTAQSRIMSSNVHPTQPGPILRVTYRPKSPAGGSKWPSKKGHGARIIDPARDTVLIESANQDDTDAALAIAAIESQLD